MAVSLEEAIDFTSATTGPVTPQQQRAYAKSVRQLIANADRLSDASARRAVDMMFDLRNEIVGDLAGAGGWDAVRLANSRRVTTAALQRFHSKYGLQLRQDQRDAWRAGSDGIDSALRAVGIESNVLMPDIDDTLVAVLQGYSADLVRGITDEARTKINGTIQRGALGAASPTQAMAEISDILVGAGVRHRQMRRRIKDPRTGRFRREVSSFGLSARAEAQFRTETGRAYAAAGQARLEMAEEHVPGLKKRWMTVVDVRTRGAHIEAHGQIRQVNGRYSIGGDLLRFPRDPAGRPGMTINCRCHSVPFKREWEKEGPEAVDIEPDEPKRPYPFDPAELEEVRGLSMEGAHAKTVYRDKAGNEWMFKPDEISGLAETAGYRIMQRMGTPAPESYMITLANQTGSIQKMWPKGLSPVRHEAIAGLEQAQIIQMQNHQVVDWMISQHDTNRGALLQTAKGNIVAVDKGQSFKFMGKDRLDWKYKPNHDDVMYNTMFKDYIEGRIERLDVADISVMLARAEKLDAGFLRETLGPYMAKTGRTDVIDLVLTRRATIRADFEALYARALAEKAARFPPALPKFTKIDQKFAKRVNSNEASGQAIMMAGNELEDGYFLAMTMAKDRGGRMLVLEAKVREAAEKNVLGKMDLVARASATTEEVYWPRVLEQIRHVNFHLKPGADGVLSVDKVQKLQALVTELAEMTTQATTTAAQKEMAKHYLNILEKLTNHSPNMITLPPASMVAKEIPKTFFPTTTVFEPYVIQATAAEKAAVAGRLKVITEKPWVIERRVEGGVMKTTGKRHELEVGSKSYAMELDQKTNAIYIPHNVAGNAYSRVGKLQIYVDDWDGSAKGITGAIEQLKKLGLRGELADKQDLELLYLQKVAHAARLEDNAEYASRVVARAGDLTDDMPMAERIRIHKEFWNARMGVDDVTDLPAYKVLPQFDNAWVGATNLRKGAASHPWWQRFDITEQELNQGLRGYNLTHKLSDGSTAAVEFLEKVLSGNGYMLNFEERVRHGLDKIQGMSASRDQLTGGSSYMFTRISSKVTSAKRGELVFNKKLLLRTDNVSYKGDKYGEVRVSAGAKAERGTTIDEWKAFAKNVDNESNIKNGFNVIDNLVQINAATRTQQQEILALLRRLDIHRIGGKDIEKVVLYQGKL